jgi:hypothetical protein
MTDLRTAGRAAKDIVNSPNCILSEALQQKLVEIHDTENVKDRKNVKIWADSVRACNSMDNKLYVERGRV